MLVLAALTAFSSGEVFYEIKADKEEALVNTTLKLSCSPGEGQCPVNRWRLSWDLPDGATIRSIHDSIGEINDYQRQGSEVRIVTNSGPRRTSETVKISAIIRKDAEEIHRGLYMRRMNLAGFKGQRTQGVVENPEIISGWVGRNFETFFTASNMTFSGTGSTTVRINFGTGNKTRYYEFFGGNPENTSKAYEISVGMTGLTQAFTRFPVALMKPENYENSVVDWSAGEYVGGSFRMRKNLGEDFLPVLAHETVHGLNERKLKWDSTSSTWFDEGTAKYVESMVQLHLRGKGKTRKLFGEDTVYYERRNGTRYRITAPSSGERDELWAYYQQDKEFMKYWNPSAYPDQRSFGYAYSELIIRNYVVNMNGTLRELYRQIRPRDEIDSSEEKWMMMSEYLDLTPCKYSERQRFEKCLKNINSYNYSIYRAENISRSTDTITLEPLGIKRTEEGKRLNLTDEDYRFGRESKFERRISSFLAAVRDFFLSWLGGVK